MNFYTVIYAPIIGGVGFDMERAATRLDVFRNEMELCSFEDNHVQQLMDAGLPYLPERSCYAVTSITHSICIV